MIKSFSSYVVFLLAFFSVFSVRSDDQLAHQFVHDNVLGTSLRLSVLASLEDAKHAEEAVLAEIERLEKILSNYNPDSEISQINKMTAPQQVIVSKDLMAVIKQCEVWQQRLPLAFSCKLGDVIEYWMRAESIQKHPDRTELRAIARQALNSTYTFDDLVSGISNEDYSWNVGGIAKGYILDKALEIARSTVPAASAIALDIGGDSVYWQADKDKPVWSVGIASPDEIDDSGDRLLGSMTVNSGAIAYSGHSSRERKIGRRSYSHILMPRDGWPKYQAVTAVVYAQNGVIADAAATALATMDIYEGIDWINDERNMEALLISSEGRLYASDNWYSHFNDADEMHVRVQARVEFELPKISSGRYRKPYVALWIENKSQEVVKNLLLLGDSERWMSENRYWWRMQGRVAPELLQGFARPTRRAGEYQLIWDGRNDFGRAVTTGSYILHVEAARENGGHERLRVPFELGAEPKIITVQGKDELGTVTLELLSLP